MKHLRRLWPYLRRYRSTYVIGLCGVVLATACGVAAPLLGREALNRLQEGTTRGAIFLIAGAIVLFALVRMFLLATSRYALLAAARRIEYDLRNDLFAHLETLSARYYDTHPTGDVTSRAINDLEGVRMMIGIGIMSITATGLMCAAAMTTMFLFQPVLAALLLIPLALMSVMMAWTGSKMHDLSLDVQAQLGSLSGRAQENFSGARVVRAFVQEENEIERFRDASLEYRARNVRLARWRAFAWAAILFLFEGAIAITLLVGGGKLIEGSFKAGDLLLFIAYQFQLLWPMIAIGWVINLAQRGVACMGRLMEILDTRPETDDARAAAGGRPLEGRIEARGLTFAYSPDRTPALRDLALRVEPGQRVALVGRTGAGKSTLVQLLLRLYPVPDGTLFVDGRDVNTIPLAELRAAIGTVPQDLFLFSEKISENIAFGGVDGVAEADVLRAAEISRLAADVEQFPQRYDQVVGERGVTLSGGQKQRTALARAIVREPRILVLDDALSSVDSHTEQEIQARLREFMRGRTSLVITHRLSAVADADRIYVFDEGRVVQEGRHEELLRAGGLYAELWEGQKLEEELSQS